jgi:hypothetical protein
MEKPLDRAEGSPEHQPEHRPRLTARDVVLGAIVAALFAAAAVVVAILSFDVNPAGPVLVVVVAIAGGSLAVRRVHDAALKAAAIGLIIGGVAAILLWPFFDVS